MADPQGLKEWGDLLIQLRTTQRLRDSAHEVIIEKVLDWLAGKGAAPSREHHRQFDQLRAYETQLLDRMDELVRSKLG